MDSIGGFADRLVDALSLRTPPLESTRVAALDDHTVLAVLAARCLDCLAHPAALSTNTRLLIGDQEVPRDRWTSSRVGHGQVLHTELRHPYIDCAVTEGRMLVIDSIDECDLVLMRLRESLEYRLSARAWINLYMTAALKSNFGLHYDTHDTLVVALCGEKRWDVGPTALPPDTEVDETVDNDLMEYRLRPGMALAMAGRTLHDVTGLGRFAMHLTIGFDSDCGFESMLRESDRLVGRYSPGVEGADLELAKARLLERRRGTSLPFAATSDLNDITAIRWASRLRPVVETLEGGGVRITSMDRKLDIDAEWSPVVRALGTGDELSFQDLMTVNGADASALHAFVHSLVDAELVICRYGSLN